ncbi:MAG: outer membrane protein assembly factor BamA [Bacteroidales bacterium]|nr:outer membrane protein assembly factor BamA [Bacteroidales bacterium]
MKHTRAFILLITMAILGALHVDAQTVISNSEAYNLDYLTPRVYEIGGITYEGADNFDKRIVSLVAGLQVGDKIKVPGDKLSVAVDNLWNQGLFEDVQILVTRIQGNVIFLKIQLKERPKLSVFKFKGVAKSDESKLREEIKIGNGTVVTENMLQTTSNKIRSYYVTKGYTRAEVEPIVESDSTGGAQNRVSVTYNVKRGRKVKIDSLLLVGNTNMKDVKILRQMKNTHDVHYYKYFQIFSKGFWSSSKYNESNFRDDLDQVISYYNEQGYRDARIVSDTVWTVPDNELKLSDKKRRNQERVKVRVNIYEGRKFYFRNITFSGNTIYDSETLARHLRIAKGDPYNRTLLETNINFNPSSTDIASMYMDNGYLFFRATPVEMAVEGDSIDIEIRITEGKQARIRNVSVEGNTVTNDNIILRELHTRPGDLFSRSDVIRSRRELATLGFFQEDKINPVPKPNAEDGTVDIVYEVQEGNTSQIQLQGGYGSKMFVLQASLILNNFSARKIMHPKDWAPLPAGDGQRLSLTAIANTSYYSFGASFTEPWLGGHRPQALSLSAFHTMLTNGFYYKRTDPAYRSLKLTSVTASFARRLKWPDDYFSLGHMLTFKHYDLQNYSQHISTFTDGVANDLSYSLTITRNSLDSPIYPRNGSELSVTGTATLPYSLINGRDYSQITDPQELYRWLEYYKVNLRGSWVLNLVGNTVLNARFRFGWMGYYNKYIGTSPFGRYFLGGDGLTMYYNDGSEIIPLRGYDNETIGASINGGGAAFDRFTLELRQLVVESGGFTAWVLGFLEGGNCWEQISDFQPFKMYQSAGVGARVQAPWFGLIGVDWGYGFNGQRGGSHFHFIIGQSID